MEPLTISASSLEAFESCQAMYKVSFIDKAPAYSAGKAGSLGTACHAALEFWVNSGQHIKSWKTVGNRLQAMRVVWDSVYWDNFDDRTYYDEGLKLLSNWLDTRTFTGKKVLSCEIKENFLLPTSKGDLPVTYIWDRCDRLDRDDGLWDVEVVDYKTTIQPVTSDDLKNKIQPRIYALAAAIKYRDAKDIWVTYDQLRYTPVSIRFTREDNKITWHYLKAIAERIYLSDGTQETLNPLCRFCVRKSSCITLKTHHEAGGILKTGDSLSGLIDQRSEAKNAADALFVLVKELDELIIAQIEQEGVHEFDTSKTALTVSASSRRAIDNDSAARILGPELMLRYGKIGVTDIDHLIKTGEITNDQAMQLKQVMTRQFSGIRVSTKPKRTFKI